MFTPGWLVRDIVDLVPAEVVGSLETTCLDPACGHGNFLVELLRWKLPQAALEARQQAHGAGGLVDPARWRTAALKALGGVYGVDIDALNVSEARDRLVAVLLAEHERVVGLISPAFAQQARAVVDRTVHLGDFLEPVLLPWSGTQFDVIVGNPPYQAPPAKTNALAMPIYQPFVLAALDLAPQYVAMVIPAKWLAGSDRPRWGDLVPLLSDRRIRKMSLFGDATQLFGEHVNVRSGVMTFLWDRDYDGDCLVDDGTTVVSRSIDEFDTFVTSNRAVVIVRKVLRVMAREGISPLPAWAQCAFGLDTFDLPGLGAAAEPSGERDVMLMNRGADVYIRRDQVRRNPDAIDLWKVVVTCRSDGVYPDRPSKVLMRTRVLPPGSASVRTYMVVDAFDSEAAARNCMSTLRTRTCRFLLSLRTPTQHVSRKCFRFVPAMPTDRAWSDSDLAEFFGLDDDDVAHIESRIRPLA